MEKTNGSATWRWVVGLVLAVAGVLAMGFGEYLLSEMREVGTTATVHAALPGHPVVMERINFMREDIDEIKTEQRKIKTGVEELLRRVPPTH